MEQQQFVDYIKLALAPIDKTNRFHREYIKNACDLVYAQKLGSIKEYEIGELELYSKTYYDQTVTQDTTHTNKYYTDLIIDIVGIPKVGSGILSINTEQGYDLDFVPVTELEMFYMDASAAHTTDTTIGYWVQGKRIWYDESMTSSIAAAGVRLQVFPRFSEFAATDTINIPGCSDFDFIQAVLQLLAPTAQVDL